MSSLRPIRLVFLLLILITGLFPALAGLATLHAQESRDVNHRLRDLDVFTDTRHTIWAGSGDSLEIVTENVNGSPALPIDSAMSFEGRPSYRVEVNGECCGWWSVLLAGTDWETYDLRPYLANGWLEFYVRGAQGGEDFSVALQDRVVMRTFDQDHTTRAIVMSTVTPITAAWQRVQLPLQDFVVGDDVFDPKQMFAIALASVDGGPLTLWLNNIRFVSPDTEPVYPAIKINQLGYMPQLEKYALVSGYPDVLTASVGTPFQVRRSADDSVAFDGQLSLVTDLDPVVSGERVLKADFSALGTPGSYYLTVEAAGIEPSPAFEIGNGVYERLLVDAGRYYLFQRQGIALRPEHAGIFARGVGHPQDADLALESNGAVFVDASGGWYDAGDYGKYIDPAATAVSDLLWAYTMFPEQFTDNQFNIPESGNGVPDLLDEIRWELDWMLKMQEPASGGFWQRVWPTQRAPVEAADEPRYIKDQDGDRLGVKPTATTASAAASLAEAAIVFRAVDAAYADRLLAAARSGWAYLEAYPGGIEALPGPYYDPDEADARLWAAAALFRATGETQFHTYFLNHYQEQADIWRTDQANTYFVDRMQAIAYLDYLAANNRDAAATEWIETVFDEWRRMMLQRAYNNPWRTTLLPDHYFWGSNQHVLNTVSVLAIGTALIGGDMDEIWRTSQAAMNYILGSNPIGISYVTGYGERSVQRPYSVMWSLDNIEDVPSGVLVGGANSHTNQLLFSRFTGKRYADSDHDWSTNEHTIYWNSALVFNAAFLTSTGSAVDLP